MRKLLKNDDESFFKLAGPWVNDSCFSRTSSSIFSRTVESHELFTIKSVQCALALFMNW